VVCGLCSTGTLRGINQVSKHLEHCMRRGGWVVSWNSESHILWLLIILQTLVSATCVVVRRSVRVARCRCLMTSPGHRWAGVNVAPTTQVSLEITRSRQRFVAISTCWHQQTHSITLTSSRIMHRLPVCNQVLLLSAADEVYKGLFIYLFFVFVLFIYQSIFNARNIKNMPGKVTARTVESGACLLGRPHWLWTREDGALQ